MASFDVYGSQAANDASSRVKIVELFNRIEHFFHRLEIYTGVTPTMAMTDIIVEIMVEVLTILAIATKEVERGRFSESKSRRFMILLTDTVFREVYQEAGGKQRHRGQPGQVGQVDTRRGTDGIGRAAEVGSSCR